MAKKCVQCGGPSPKGYPLCWDCFTQRERQRFSHVDSSYDEEGYPIEQPESEMCVMCGREWGTNLQKDGKYYCSLCWTIWNS